MHSLRLSRDFHLRRYESVTSRFPHWSWLSFDQTGARAGKPRTPSTHGCTPPQPPSAPALALPAAGGWAGLKGRSKGLCLTRLSFLMRSATSPHEPLHWHREEAEGRAHAAQGSSPGAARHLLPSQLASIHGAMVRAQWQEFMKNTQLAVPWAGECESPTCGTENILCMKSSNATSYNRTVTLPMRLLTLSPSISCCKPFLLTDSSPTPICSCE